MENYFKSLVLLLVLCFSQNIFSQTLELTEIPDSLLQNANAVIRYHHTEIKFNSPDKINIKEQFAATALNKRGLAFLQFNESYKEGSSKIKNITIKILDASGKGFREIKKNEIEDYASYDGFSIITDYRRKYFEFESNNFPVTIIYEFERESKNTLSVPVWFPIPGYGVATQESTYQFIGRPFVSMQVSEKNIEGLNISNNEEYNYKAFGLKSLLKERYTPDIISVLPHVRLNPSSFTYEGYSGNYTNWDQYGKWIYKNLLATRNNLQKLKVKQELDGIIQSEKDPKMISKLIYEYIQNTTRYISIALDEGGVQPMKSMDVHEQKYGDCKALSYYMKTLLDLYEIPSNYVEIYAGSDALRDYDPEFASMNQGNHIILNIPFQEDTAWVDCTSSHLPFNYLGTFTDDRRALIINESGGQLTRTPRYDEQLNKRVYDIQTKVNADGSMASSFSYHSYGMFMGDRLHMKQKSQEEKDDYLKESFFSLFDKIQLDKSSFILDKTSISSKEEFEIQSQHYGEIAGNYLLIPVKFKSFRIPRLKKSSKRKYPIKFLRSYQESSNQEILLPDDFKVSGSLEDFAIETEYGAYNLKYDFSTPNKLIIVKSFKLNKGVYDASKYNDIKNFLDQIIKKESSQITTKK